MDVCSRSFSATDPAALSLLHHRHLGGRPFRPSDYGACSMSDLLEAACTATRQEVIRVTEGRVRLSPTLEEFVSRASRVLEEAEGRALSLGAFDEAYTARFGNYCVPDMSYRSVHALFAEFTRDFEVLERGGGKTLLSLSRKRRLEMLEGDLRKILHAVPERAVPLERMDDAYLAECGGRDLDAALKFIPAYNLTEAVGMLRPEAQVFRKEARN